MKRICVLAAATLAASTAAFAADVLPPPPTPAGTTVDTIRGVRVADPYRWLEDWNLLRTSANSGHGIGSSLNERIAGQTDQLTLLFDQLGMSLGAQQ